MAEVSPSTAISHIRPDDISWWESSIEGKYAIFFQIGGSDVWITLASEQNLNTDLAVEAVAMRKLASTATEMVAKLEQRAAGRCPDCGRAECTGEDCYWPEDAGLRPQERE